MKKITLSSAILALCVSLSSFAQIQSSDNGNASHWRTKGNTAATDDFLGTSNSRPLIFKTNGIEHMRITETGFIGIEEPNPTERLHIKGNARVVGNFASTGNLEVTGQATFKDKLTAERGVMFDNNNGITLTPSDGTSPSILTFGRKPSTGFSFLDPCLSPNPNQTWNAFQDYITIWGNSTVAGEINAMSVGVDGGNGYIDMAGPGNTSANLLLNYRCGKDVFICTGNEGGDINMGAGVKSKINISGKTIINGQVGLGTDNPREAFQIGDEFTIHNGGTKYIARNAYYDASAATNKRLVAGPGGFFAFSAQGNIAIQTFTSGVAGDEIKNTDIKNAIVINNNGKVGIGVEDPGSFQLAVEGKIGASEVEVTLARPWPDYVFAKEYKLMPINKLENFLKENKHLPNVPAAKEMEEAKGIKLGEMQVKHLEKTEELFLYIIELNKKIERLEKEKEEMNERLKKVE